MTQRAPSRHRPVVGDPVAVCRDRSHVSPLYDADTGDITGLLAKPASYPDTRDDTGVKLWESMPTC